MATSLKFFAWAVPILFDESPWDHTWVTTYDNRAHPYPDIAGVIHAKQDYWYCWGGFHARGGTPSLPDGTLGSQNGDLGLARCLVAPNADCSPSFAARGTIFSYGVDGVCHQLANQVLYATRLGGARPLTVSVAGGYWVSSGVYGAYGLQHSAWRSKIATCTAVAAAPPSRARGATRTRRLGGSGPDMSGANPPIRLTISKNTLARFSARPSWRWRLNSWLCAHGFKPRRRLTLMRRSRRLRSSSTPAISASWTTPPSCSATTTFTRSLASSPARRSTSCCPIRPSERCAGFSRNLFEAHSGVASMRAYGSFSLGPSEAVIR